MSNRNFTQREYHAMLKRFEQIEAEYLNNLERLNANEYSSVHITYSRQRTRNIERLFKAMKTIKEFPFSFNRQYHFKNRTYTAYKPQIVTRRKNYTSKIEF